MLQTTYRIPFTSAYEHTTCNTNREYRRKCLPLRDTFPACFYTTTYNRATSLALEAARQVGVPNREGGQHANVNVVGIFTHVLGAQLATNQPVTSARHYIWTTSVGARSGIPLRAAHPGKIRILIWKSKTGDLQQVDLRRVAHACGQVDTSARGAS